MRKAGSFGPAFLLCLLGQLFEQDKNLFGCRGGKIWRISNRMISIAYQSQITSLVRPAISKRYVQNSSSIHFDLTLSNKGLNNWIAKAGELRIQVVFIRNHAHEMPETASTFSRRLAIFSTTMASVIFRSPSRRIVFPT